uniref:carboxyl transferase domain-containing protein n=1 Tax=Clostridium phoceensis TaxID=1650661 RepID=UPI0023F90A2A
MEEIFARRKARLMELRARRKGEDGEPKRLAARPVFDKCPSCGAVVPKTELSHSLYVCTKCGYHHTIGAYLRLAMLLDSKSFRELDQDLVAPNVLGFPGYEEKLERQRDKTGLMEAVVTARGRVEGRSVVAAALDSRFFMGSMGAAVGEKVTRCVEYAQRNRLPLIIFSASGGARMQEGILSLMQMAKT